MLLKHYELHEHETKLLNMSVKEFDQYMMKNYPEMFKQRYGNPEQKIILPINFGFEIGQGWRHILDMLCKKLKVIQETTGFICVFDQIKEKFGGGRFYYHIESKKGRPETSFDDIWCALISDCVNMAENYTDYVCEELGINYNNENRIYYPGWIYGMSEEGFKQWAIKAFGEDEGKKQIEVALEYTKEQRRLEALREEIYNLRSNQEIGLVESLVASIKQQREKKNG